MRRLQILQYPYTISIVHYLLGALSGHQSLNTVSTVSTLVLCQAFTLHRLPNV